MPDTAAAIAELLDLGFEFSPPVPEADSAEYGAALTSGGGTTIRLRAARLTPRKVGLFVAVWRRAAGGSTEPFSVEDAPDLLLITAREGDRCGAFVFPRAALAERGILSVNGEGGKRGFRLYPPWSQASNPQAIRSQRWQCEFFLELGGDVDVGRAARLLTA